MYTYLRVNLVLQVEQAKQFTHQALLRAETTGEREKTFGDILVWEVGELKFSNLQQN